ncbi:1716_t:CDS:10 [Ambispora gerdemannii]|uniref:1716_t:CDS:1 n=1 Tax=Ambispora gerdemannii TaxID=144530 RepID=A0A9N8WKN3_9GLOM|nr:1716_t:CDS:10 [Ambispora gerdemannii]
MSTSRTYRILWSPHPGINRFLIGSNDLKLYEYKPKGHDGNPTPKMITVNSDPLMKCFTWSPDPNYSTLIAVGQTSGKTLLINMLDDSTLMENSNSSPSNFIKSQTTTATSQSVYLPQQSAAQTKFQFNVRYSRACNVVRFCEKEPRLLAIGLDKVRNDSSLLIWDVEQATKVSSSNPPVGDYNKRQYSGSKISPDQPISRTGSISGWSDRKSATRFNYTFQETPIISRPLPIVPTLSSSAPSYTRADDTKPLHSYGNNETVNSCAWFPTTSRRLVAGMAGKYLRIYDLRAESSTHVSAVSTKAVYGLKVDTFNVNPISNDISLTRIIIKYYVLSITTESRPIRVAFSPKRAGLLAVLEKDSAHLTLYDIQESSGKYIYSSPTLSQRAFSSMNLELAAGSSSALSRQQSMTMSGYPSSSMIGVKGSKSIISFAWIPTTSTSSSYRILTINKDADIDTMYREESLQISWAPRGNMILASGRRIKIYDTETNNDYEDEDGIRKTIHYTPELATFNSRTDSLYQTPAISTTTPKIYNQKRTLTSVQQFQSPFLSVQHDNETESGNRTPRPGDITAKDAGSLGKRLHGMALEQQDKTVYERRIFDNRHDDLSPWELRNDISVIIRERAGRGYSMNCITNKDIVRNFPKLIALWNWISEAQSRALESNSHIGITDNSYHGIHTIWQGLSSSSVMSTPKVNQSRFFISSQILDANEIPFVQTSKPAQRKLSLSICGWGFGKKELEEALIKMEHSKEFEKAAGWALFHGLTERAIKALNNSQDERLKLVSAALAGYAIHNQDESYQPNSLWREMCRNLSLEMREPYLRAMFSYIASGHWFDVLQEEKLSLGDRIGIALRFLNDSQLDAYINETTTKVMSAGDIEGIVLTGLTSKGVNLFEQYVNNTGDVQTASLALSFCVPRQFKDNRVVQWVESYRQLLDQWAMFHDRANFDIERGKHIGPNPAGMVAPQVSVRCNFCNHSIVHGTFSSSPSAARPPSKGKDGKQRQGGGPTISAKKATCCPDCRKPLPRCAICLLSLGMPIDSLRESFSNVSTSSSAFDGASNFDLWFTWCQTCRHGGHAKHISQWFQKHKFCPVSDCSCQCNNM